MWDVAVAGTDLAGCFAAPEAARADWLCADLRATGGTAGNPVAGAYLPE